MAYKSGKCYACHKHRPVQGHHIKPVEYGGPKDGRLVNICADCHNILHREAEVYYKHGKFQDLDQTIPYVQGGFGERLRQLIAEVIIQRQQFDAGLTEISEQRLMTQISWDSDQELLLAHDVKRRMKFKSLARMLKHLVFEQYQRLQEK